jgi:hypothetical protein
MSQGNTSDQTSIALRPSKLNEVNEPLEDHSVRGEGDDEVGKHGCCALVKAADTSTTLGALLSDFATGGVLLDRANFDARHAVAAVFVACMIKVRVMDKVKHKDLEHAVEPGLKWDQPNASLQGRSVCTILEDCVRPGYQLRVTQLDKIGAGSRKLVAALCLCNWQRITLRYELGSEVQHDPSKFLCNWGYSFLVRAPTISSNVDGDDSDAEDPFARLVMIDDIPAGAQAVSELCAVGGNEGEAKEGEEEEGEEEEVKEEVGEEEEEGGGRQSIALDEDDADDDDYLPGQSEAPQQLRQPRRSQGPRASHEDHTALSLPGQWYTRTAAQFVTMSDSSKVRLHHVGRMVCPAGKEGVPADVKCWRCRHAGVSCLVYRSDAEGTDLPSSCAHCVSNKTSCGREV